MNWLLREFALRRWVLPPDQGGERLHGWLVRAAVVGSENVTAKFNPHLEAAIDALAQITWWRLEQGRKDLSEVSESFEIGIEIENPDDPLRLAADREDEAEAATWSPEERRRAERVLPAYTAGLKLGLVAMPWLDLDLDVPLKLIEQWNHEVGKAIQAVALAVAAALAAASAPDPAGESGQPAPETQSGQPAPSSPSSESGQPGA